jgi:hypothetical protein
MRMVTIETYLDTRIREVIGKPQAEVEQYKAAYAFAYSPRGMNKSRNHAELFADRWLRDCNGKDLLLYAYAYRFAYISRGMDKSPFDAEKFADRWMASGLGQTDLEKFIELYLFAYSSSGMNKSRSGAEQFAREKTGASESLEVTISKLRVDKYGRLG